MAEKKLTVEQLVVGQMQANCYLVTDEVTKDTLIVDPGDDGEYIIEAIQKKQLKPQAIVATHGHFDHIMSAFELQHTYDVPFLIGDGDEFLLSQMGASAKHFLGLKDVDPPPKPTKTLHNGESVNVGSHQLSVLTIPGHTPGSIALVSRPDKWIIVGDVLFAGGAIGRSDFSYSDPDEIGKSVQKILAFPKDFTLYPGHGEKTTIRSSLIDCKLD